MVFGYLLFADFEQQAGEFPADMAFGVVGAVFGGLIHEIALNLFRLE